MFDLMRPYVIITNLLTLSWFITLQFFRFKDTGRGCCGDFLTKEKLPANYSTVYLGNKGQFLMYYVIAHHTVYILQKIVCILITNKHESEYEKKKSLIQNQVWVRGVGRLQRRLDLSSQVNRSNKQNNLSFHLLIKKNTFRTSINT